MGDADCTTLYISNKTALPVSITTASGSMSLADAPAAVGGYCNGQPTDDYTLIIDGVAYPLTASQVYQMTQQPYTVFQLTPAVAGAGPTYGISAFFAPLMKSAGPYVENMPSGEDTYAKWLFTYNSNLEYFGPDGIMFHNYGPDLLAAVMLLPDDADVGAPSDGTSLAEVTLHASSGLHSKSMPKYVTMLVIGSVMVALGIAALVVTQRTYGSARGKSYTFSMVFAALVIAGGAALVGVAAGTGT